MVSALLFFVFVFTELWLSLHCLKQFRFRGHMLFPETWGRKILRKKHSGVTPSGVTQSSEGVVALEYRSDPCCGIPTRDDCQKPESLQGSLKETEKDTFLPMCS